MSPQDVAVKVFSKQEYSKEIIQSFRQEVLLIVTAGLVWVFFRKRLSVFHIIVVRLIFQLDQFYVLSIFPYRLYLTEE